MAWFKIDDAVWCYDGSNSPKKGIITEVEALGLRGTYRCMLLDDKIAPCRIWIGAHLYGRPSERARLCDALEIDSNFLQQWATKIREEGEEI